MMLIRSLTIYAVFSDVFKVVICFIFALYLIKLFGKV